MASLDPNRGRAIGAVKGLIFDCDGVLLNSRLANISFYNQLRRKAALPPLTPAEEEYVHMSTYEQALDFILKGSDRSRVSGYLDEMEDSFDYYDLLKVEDGLTPLLDWLADAGFRLGICTNRLSPLDAFLARFGLDKYFNPMQTASNSTPKPSPDGLFKAVAAWRLSPSEVAYIGDSKVDELAAKAAGMPFWAFKNLDLEAALHIPDFSTLEGWLRKNLNLGKKFG